MDARREGGLRGEIRADARGRHVTATISGAFEMPGAEALNRAILAAAAECEAVTILVDIREVTGAISTFERFRYVSHLVGLFRAHHDTGQLLTTRLAYLGHEPVLDVERFGESVARNRGVDVKATTQLDEALAWLRDGA